jgi:hypothetical protein
VISTINGSYVNITPWSIVIDTINGSYTNVTIWNTVINTINGSYVNVTPWSIVIIDINGSYVNETHWKVIIDTINGSYLNTTHWKTVIDTINGSYINTTHWKTVIDSVNGSYINTTHWKIIISTINGSYYNATFTVTFNVTFSGKKAVCTANPSREINRFMWNVSEDDGVYNGSTGWVNSSIISQYTYLFNDEDSITVTLYGECGLGSDSYTRTIPSTFNAEVDYEEYDKDETKEYYDEEIDDSYDTEEIPWYSPKTNSEKLIFAGVFILSGVIILVIFNRIGPKYVKVGDYNIFYKKKRRK